MNIESIKMAIIDFTALPNLGLYIGYIIISLIFMYKLVSDYRFYIRSEESAERYYQCIDDDLKDYRFANLNEPRKYFCSSVKLFTFILVISLLIWTLIYLLW
ncbi:hypothetical protein L5L78_08535 [Shewanella sp. SM34]|uniref:hypothetical protein n=1 Tax=unclassified Shewanella TaxID=196818 RepID=UPI0021D88C4F|nr:MULTISPECIES: hypothetical protein [unclassified Shewanella]MCU8056247.1 hypothetical protein [Shewanella sp. SM35]MCU8065181.1 hypothetical protein [Shewanella sp. SM34]